MEANKDDVNFILNAIKRMPNISAKKEDLVKPTPAFVISFYHVYLNELKDICRRISCCCISLNEVTEMCPRDVEVERFLFLFTRYILNLLGINYFNICDFYRPTSRTKTTIKALIYFKYYLSDISSSFKELLNNFLQITEEKSAKNKRILDKKGVLSELSYSTGLKKEKLELLKKEYEVEEELEWKIGKGSAALDDESEKLEQEFKLLSNTLQSEESQLEQVNREIDILLEQVVSEEEYYFCKSKITELQISDEEADLLIADLEESLKQKHKDIEHYKRCADILDIDLPFLKTAEEIENTKDQITKHESANYIEDIKKIQKILEAHTEHLETIGNEFKNEKNGLNKRLLEKEHESTFLSQKLCNERMSQKELNKSLMNYELLLKQSDNECAKLFQEQELLEETHREIYKEMLEQQNLLTTNFSDSLNSLMEKYSNQ